RIDGEFRDGIVRPLVWSARRTAGHLRFLRGWSWAVLDRWEEFHPRLQMPVLLVWGAADRTFPLPLALRMATEFPNATVRAIDGARLFVHEERPGLVAAEILRFHGPPTARADPSEGRCFDHGITTEAVMNAQIGTASGGETPPAPVTPEAALARVKRVYVAVHGIGEQFQYATIQSVATRLSRHLKVSAPLPLGSFHTGKNGPAYPELKHPPYPQELTEVGLAEVYWAPVPREVVKERYTLEEAKRWAKSLVERIRMRAAANAVDQPALAAKADGTTAVRDAPKRKDDLTEKDFEMMAQVIGEMVEGVAILDRLLFLVGKVTSFKFQLKELLDDFLGDVQVVTDFKSARDDVLDRFDEVMSKIHKANPTAKVYLVAHSEGTVVTFLALLRAFDGYVSGEVGAEEKYGWVMQVKGLMTFGSPIEVHQLLWPELWEDYAAKREKLAAFRQRDTDYEPIKWRNYFDRGDPIAYPLTKTAEWLEANEWTSVFDFKPKDHEYGFSRYLFPGKAHIDYWEDEEVFDHFLNTVVQVKPASQVSKSDTESQGAPQKPPENRHWIPLASRFLPYAVPFFLIVTAVYVLFMALQGYDTLPQCEKPRSFKDLVQNVTGLSLLLFGVTVAARVPRLSRTWSGCLVGYLAFLIGAAAYPPLTTGDVHDWMGRYLGQGLEALFGPAWSKSYDWPACGLIALGMVLTVAGMIYSANYPALGAKALIVPGGFVIVALVASGVYKSYSGIVADSERNPLWVVLLAETAFLYLWWLAIVCFDLIYIWHHYVRGSLRGGVTAADRLRTIRKDPA
ncbi:MAG TPA: alpha/beta hydrolase, partial [Urbifossiella sp.]|nr:alpha/beta hydrolase [Urbifossiella sp.]